MSNINMEKSLILVGILSFIGYSTALECFTCFEQDDNKDKCVKTTKQCLEFQESCSTFIEWKIPRYWVPRGDRIYYISKDCDTQQRCQDKKYQYRTKCKRDWYRDWQCVECCTGDRCNYYVTMGAGTANIGILTVAAAVVIAMVQNLL